MGRDSEEEFQEAPNALFDLLVLAHGGRRVGGSKQVLSQGEPRREETGRAPCTAVLGPDRLAGSARGSYRGAERTGPTETPPPSAAAAPAGY